MTKPSGGIPLSEWSGSGATRKLHEAIRNFNEQTDRQTREIIRPTKVMTWLAVVTLVAAGVQVPLAVIALVE